MICRLVLVMTKFLIFCPVSGLSSVLLTFCRRCPPTIFLPKVATDSCGQYLDHHINFRLHGQEVDMLLPTYTLQGVEAGEKIKLTGKQNADKVVEVFHCYHSVSCVGYGFLQMKKKMKPEYVGMEGKQLGQLRRQGVEIDYLYENPMFVFMGDTTAQFYVDQAELEKEGKENVFRYPLIITECTFLGTDADDAERANKTKHTLWPELKPFIESHPNITFVLIHFSHRYSEKTIREFFAKEKLANVVAFVEGEETSVLRQDITAEDEY